MKKLTILTLTAALTALTLGSQTIPTQAAPTNSRFQSIPINQISCRPNGNKIFFTFGSSCNIQDIFDQLENCFPEINTPDTETPEINKPDAEAPEADKPNTESPEINKPEAELPGVSTPDNDNNTNDNVTQAPTPDEDSSQNSHAFIQEVVDLVNAERAKEGLTPLTLDTKVQAAAQVRAEECTKSFSHTRPDGSSFATALKEQNVSYKSAGENIAWGQRSPQDVMDAWMNSKGHRANIMNPNFTTIGVGYHQTVNGTNYWCQLFTR